jgi:hypothetical protein
VFKTAPAASGGSLFGSKPKPKPGGGLLQAPPTLPTGPVDLVSVAPVAATAPVVDLSAARSAALALLPGAAGAALQQVWEQLPDAQRVQLADLVQTRKLDGEAVQKLEEFLSEPRAAGLDGRALLTETVASVAEPDAGTYQGDRFTCGAACVQRQIAGEHPATFIALVEGLSEPVGVGPLPSGLGLQRIDGSEQPDESGRNSLNRLVQGALMGLAGEYDPRTDRFAADPTPGLKKHQVAKLTALSEGGDQVVLEHNSRTTGLLREIIEATAPGETFQIGSYWNKQDHMLLFLGHKDGEVTFFNPQEHATSTLPLKDFLWKTQFALLSAAQVQGKDLPGDEVQWLRLGQ